MKIGVLSVQGAFAEHASLLESIGVEAVGVRLPEHLEDLAGLVLPGGESTTMRKLIDRWGLRRPILALAREGVPVLGTCAGMILLATRISDGDEPVFPLLDITVKRNAFGRQLDSFEADVAVPVLGDRARARRLHPGAGRGAGRLRAWTSWRGWTTVASWPSGSATSSPPPSIRSWPASRASTDCSRRWPAPTRSPRRVRGGATTPPGAADRRR